MGLPAQRDIVVAIGKLRHDRAARTRLRFLNQPLQFGGASGQGLAFVLELLAVIEFVFGGIGEGRRHAFTHVGAARHAEAERR